jgi:hypothetical protein
MVYFFNPSELGYDGAVQVLLIAGKFMNCSLAIRVLILIFHFKG